MMNRNDVSWVTPISVSARKRREGMEGEEGRTMGCELPSCGFWLKLGCKIILCARVSFFSLSLIYRSMREIGQCQFGDMGQKRTVYFAESPDTTDLGASLGPTPTNQLRGISV
jgi:hypothetical protein